MAPRQSLLSMRTLAPAGAWLVFAAVLASPVPLGTKGALALLPVLATAWATGRWGGALAGLAAVAGVVVAQSVTTGVAFMALLVRNVLAYAVTPAVGFASGWFFERAARTKAIAAQLQAQTRRLQQAQRQAAIGDWVLDGRSLEVTASEETLRIFGLPLPSRMPLDRFMEHVHPDDVAAVGAMTRDALDRDHAFAADFRVIRPDGTVRWVEGHGEVEQDGRRRIVRGTTQDVTERKEVEQRLATMLEHHPDGVARFTREGTCLQRNAAWLATVGSSDLDGSGAWVQATVASLEQSMRTASCTEFIAWHDGPGIERALQTQVVPEVDGAGRVSTFLVVARDVTRMRDAEQRLRRAHDTLQVMLEAAPVPIMQVDAEGRVVLANQATEDLFGHPRASILGRRPPMVPAEAQEEYAAGMFSGVSVVHDTLRVASDGTQIPVDAYAAPLPEGGFVRIDIDLRERKSLEEARRETEKLRDIDAFKTEFLNTAAHELSTPLTPIKLQLAMMRDPTRPDNGVDLLARNIGRLERLVRDLLDAARLQSGQLQFEATDLDLHDSLVDAVRSFQPRAKELGLALHADIEDRLSILGDPQRVSQVLFNLLSNACKFTPNGGTVDVRSRREADEIVLEVVDSGHGMTRHQIDGLFQPFSQFHRDRVGAHVGTGLGLYICRGIMEAHGGSIEAESPGVGRGATFRLRFPAAPSAVPTPGPARTPHVGPASAAGPASSRG